MVTSQEHMAVSHIDYANMCIVAANFCNLKHTNEEFILDFGLIGGDPTKNVINTSIVISPYTAKRLSMSMNSIVNNWEQSFGEIKIEVDDRLIAQQPIQPTNSSILQQPLELTPQSLTPQSLTPQSLAPKLKPIPPAFVQSFGDSIQSDNGQLTIEIPEGAVLPIGGKTLNNSPCIPATESDNKMTNTDF